MFKYYVKSAFNILKILLIVAAICAAAALYACIFVAFGAWIFMASIAITMFIAGTIYDAHRAAATDKYYAGSELDYAYQHFLNETEYMLSEHKSATAIQAAYKTFMNAYDAYRKVPGKNDIGYEDYYKRVKELMENENLSIE